MKQTEKKENKRRKGLIFVMLLALVVALAFGGYTFSKYITTKQQSGQAQVAKWGFKISVNAADLFGKNYIWDNGKNGSIVTNENDKTKVTVQTGGDYNVVAPGTKGSMTFKVEGKAEVLAQLKLKLSDVKDIVLKIAKGGTTYEYYPVKWTLTKVGVTAPLVNGGKLSEVATKLNDANAAWNSKIEVNTEITHDFTLSWEWAFDGSAVPDDLTAFNLKADVLDTILGYLMNGTAVDDICAQLGLNSTEYTIDKDNSVLQTAFKLDIEVVQLQKH